MREQRAHAAEPLAVARGVQRRARRRRRAVDRRARVQQQRRALLLARGAREVKRRLARRRRAVDLRRRRPRGRRTTGAYPAAALVVAASRVPWLPASSSSLTVDAAVPAGAVGGGGGSGGDDGGGGGAEGREEGGDKSLSAFDTAVLAGGVEGGAAVGGGGADGGAPLQQRRHAVDVARLARGVQRRDPVVAREVDRRARVEQLRGDGGVPLEAGHVERGGARGEAAVDVGVVIEQQLDAAPLPALRRQVQRRRVAQSVRRRSRPGAARSRGSERASRPCPP